MNPTPEFRPGERVVVAGEVAFERSGFVTVRWDNGSSSTVRALDLRREDERAEVSR